MENAYASEASEEIQLLFIHELEFIALQDKQTRPSKLSDTSGRGRERTGRLVGARLFQPKPQNGPSWRTVRATWILRTVNTRSFQTL